jgi:hypothetical protein
VCFLLIEDFLEEFHRNFTGILLGFYCINLPSTFHVLLIHKPISYKGYNSPLITYERRYDLSEAHSYERRYDLSEAHSYERRYDLEEAADLVEGGGPPITSVSGDNVPVNYCLEINDKKKTPGDPDTPLPEKGWPRSGAN